jgi:hypothetical protein
MLSYFFGGKKEDQEKAVKESEDPLQALKDSLDSHGEFGMDEDGTFDYKSLTAIKAVVLRQGNREMTRTHEPALQAQKIEAYKT